ncbi:MAG: DUF4065 domain-containing protein [Oscillospiraceae bacterium]|jgi:uncharacterized phage-associated protein|nr:DUF4065 domain-containing protein [Oscillospiraceae bacterium]
MLSPLTYANSIIKKALETKTPLSPMKLQKLMYLTYARYLFRQDAPLFAERFEKWRFGPVLSDVYDEFKGYKAQSIDDFYYNCDGKAPVVSTAFWEFYQCLDEVWSAFGCWDGISLSGLTHRPGTAWNKATGIFLEEEDIREDGKLLFAGT